MHVLFANTGVQIVCVPLKRRHASRPPRSATDGSGAARGTGEENQQPVEYPYIQWQIIQTGAARLFLAVDTTCGDPEVGYFCDGRHAGAATTRFAWRACWTCRASRCGACRRVELCIRPATATAGDAKHVHMVVDFGNSRTGALLLEMVGEIAQTPQMMPFELNNRYHMDAWNEDGRAHEPARLALVLVEDPLVQHALSAAGGLHEDRVSHRRPRKRRAGSGAERSRRRNKVEVEVTPPLFDDLSMVRMGREADDLLQVMRAEGDIRTGLSSPKRYLWADDASWLEGANWYMADPADRCETGLYASLLRGPLSALRPRGRPRFPPGRRSASPSRLRPRGAAEAAPRPAGDDDRRALRNALPGVCLRQLGGLSGGLGRRRPDPRNPHPLAHFPQRHDPRGAAPLARPRPKRRSTSSR